MRINARLDKQHSERLGYLQKVTGKSVTDIVKEAIDVSYERQVRSGRHGLDLLRDGAFVGCAEADENLSSNYKQEIGKILDRKHDRR